MTSFTTGIQVLNINFSYVIEVLTPYTFINASLAGRRWVGRYGRDNLTMIIIGLEFHL